MEPPRSMPARRRWLMLARSRYRGDASMPPARAAGGAGSIDRADRHSRGRPASPDDRHVRRPGQRRIDRSALAVPCGGAARRSRSVGLDEKGDDMATTATLLSKKADLAGPGIGDYGSSRRSCRADTARSSRRRDAAVRSRGEALHRGQPLPRARPDQGRGSPDRRRRERVNDYLDRDGSRTPVSVPHLERPRQHPSRRAGRPGGDQVEEDGAAASSACGRAKALSPTCGRCARTTSSITITAPTSTSGTGSRQSPPSSATSDYLRETVRQSGRS